MNIRNCECCHGSYATGRDYGDWWCELPLAKETKGLCEFCNPNSKWYVPDKDCHKGVK